MIRLVTEVDKAPGRVTAKSLLMVYRSSVKTLGIVMMLLAIYSGVFLEDYAQGTFYLLIGYVLFYQVNNYPRGTIIPFR